MIVRVVNMRCITGKEEDMRRIGRENLVPINKEAGCMEVYFLEPSSEDEPSMFGVVSVWRNKDVLNNMKNSERYRSLLQMLAPAIESITDRVYTTSVTV